MNEQEIKKYWAEYLPNVDLESGDPGATYKQKHPFQALETMKMPEFDPTVAGTVAMTVEQSLEIPDSPTNPPKTSEVSNFRVIDKLGEGGMGVVYRGWQDHLCRDVAVKKLLGKTSNTFQKESFLAEAIVSAFLDHPNIVPVYELGEDAEGEPVLVMKLIQGAEWADLLPDLNGKISDEGKDYDLEDHLGILEQVCNAVSFAHKKGIVHCDLKPGNVMIGEDGEVMLMDWGLAIDIHSESRTSESEKLLRGRDAIKGPSGTPSYMPFELAEGKGGLIGEWTDVYLLGAILFEILVGHPPHMAKSFLEVLMQASKGEIPEIPDSVPDELADICRKSLAREPKDRYQKVAAFKKDLQRYIRHRESLVISDEAEKVLATCLSALEKVKAEGIKSFTDKARNQLYEDFTVAVGGFQQAKMLWKANPDCDKGETNTRSAYAEASLLFGDLSLAEAQVAKLKERSHDVEELTQRINERREIRLRNKLSVNRLKYTLAISASVIIVGLSIGLLMVNSAHNETKTARKAAEVNKDKALEKEKEARESLIRVTQLADVTHIAEFEEEASQLWPASSKNVPALQSWLKRSQLITDRLNLHKRTLKSFRRSAQSLSDDQLKLLQNNTEEARLIEVLRGIVAELSTNISKLEKAKAVERSKFLAPIKRLGHQLLELQFKKAAFLTQKNNTESLVNKAKTLVTSLEGEIARLESEKAKRQYWSFPKLEQQWEHDVLTDLVKRLETFKSSLVPSIKRRIEQAQVVHRESIVKAQSKWQEAQSAIAKHPQYHGLQLSPQEGLVPLGPDPKSGLWEFADLRTGVPPVRGANGRWDMKAETGLVFILVPAGTYMIGADDPKSSVDERPVHEVSVASFFLSKYEMTQAQWERVTGENPSFFKYGPMNPVEQVSWNDSNRVLFQLGLVLPTEVQWEFAARAGTTSVWWTGDDVTSLKNAANLADIAYKEAGGTNLSEDWKNDGYPEHAPIGRFRVNAFGFHDVVGNVWEWCADSYASYELPIEKDTGLRKVFYPKKRAYRGGSWRFAAIDARSANRNRLSELGRDRDIGLRPARAIEK